MTPEQIAALIRDVGVLPALLFFVLFRLDKQLSRMADYQAKHNTLLERLLEREHK